MILLLKLSKLSLFTVSKLSLFHIGIAREEKVLLLADVMTNGKSSRKVWLFRRFLPRGERVKLVEMSKDTNPWTALNRNTRSLTDLRYVKLSNPRNASLSE